MKHLHLVFIFSILTSLCFSKSYGQHKETPNEPFNKHSSISLVLSHAHVFNGRDDAGKKKVLALPSWGIDYNYYFNPKWAIGLHTDIILESFKVEGKEGVAIERSTPIAPAIMVMYKPGEHWNLLAGIGEEFAKEDNFFMTRIGTEYGVDIRNGWEVSGSFMYDLKWNAYDSWVLGIGISKSFGGNKKETSHKVE